MACLRARPLDQGLQLLVARGKRDPLSAAAHLGQSRSYSAAGDLQEAEAAIKKAIDLGAVDGVRAPDAWPDFTCNRTTRAGIGCIPRRDRSRLRFAGARLFATRHGLSYLKGVSARDTCRAIHVGDPFSKKMGSCELSRSCLPANAFPVNRAAVPALSRAGRLLLAAGGFSLRRSFLCRRGFLLGRGFLFGYLCARTTSLGKPDRDRLFPARDLLL